MGCHRSVGTVGLLGCRDQLSFRALAAALTPGLEHTEAGAPLVLAQTAAVM